ncbi:MAG TPA: hypothetical protein VGE50_13030 [Gammaproteobacteria bacterium]
MARFTPCFGRTVCRDDGVRCLACNRSLAEIARTGEVVEAVTRLLEELNYENPEQFLAYLSAKVTKKLKARNGKG